MSLYDDLLKAGEAPAPKDFRPGVTYAGRDLLGARINTDAIPPVETEEEWEQAVRDMGIHIPDGYTLRLVRAELAGSSSEAAWHRDPADKGEQHTAYTAPAKIMRWRYQFEVVLKDSRADEDFAALMKEAKRAARGRPLAPRTGGCMVIALADFQAGKVSVLGGTPELLERSEVALRMKLEEIRRLRPASIVLADIGDSIEGFFSAPGAARSNDLQVTEQVRVWRRIFWRWVEAVAKLTDDLTVLSVPSNHCEAARSGKARLGPVSDDWGLEVLSQVADLAAVNPTAYGHVKFVVPREYDEHVTLTIGGTVATFAHGHQERNVKMMGAWVKKHGRGEIGQSDLVLVGHHHHLRVEALGQRQFLFVAPTNDNGSDWFTPKSGENSGPGVLSFVTEGGHWRDLHVAWT